MPCKQAQHLTDTMNKGQVSSALAEDYGLEADADWLELVNVMALEIYGTKEVGQYRNNLTTITVITGTRGPGVEFTVDRNDRVVGSAHWGSDSAEAYDNLPGLFDTRVSDQPASQPHPS